jgi:hypothetical protein
LWLISDYCVLTVTKQAVILRTGPAFTFTLLGIPEVQKLKLATDRHLVGLLIEMTNSVTFKEIKSKEVSQKFCINLH